MYHMCMRKLAGRMSLFHLGPSKGSERENLECVKDNETNNILRVTYTNQELCVQAIISYAYQNDFISLTRG